MYKLQNVLNQVSFQCTYNVCIMYKYHVNDVMYMYTQKYCIRLLSYVHVRLVLTYTCTHPFSATYTM